MTEYDSLINNKNSLDVMYLLTIIRNFYHLKYTDKSHS